MAHFHGLAACVVLGALAAGCATEQQTETAVGAGVGAATGAVLGGAVTGSARGTAIGAAVGAGVGAAVGYNWPLVKEKIGIATKGTAVNLTEEKDGALKVNVPGSIAFVSGSARLSPKLYPTLDKIATTLTQHPETTVDVVGHSDSSGNREANHELARGRAAAVADYLVERGVSRGRITVDSRGDLEPVADNATEAGRAQNRRVELLIRELGA